MAFNYSAKEKHYLRWAYFGVALIILPLPMIMIPDVVGPFMERWGWLTIITNVAGFMIGVINHQRFLDEMFGKK